MSTLASSVQAQRVHLQILAAPPPFVAALCPPRPHAMERPPAFATAPGDNHPPHHHDRWSRAQHLCSGCALPSGVCVLYDGLIHLTICLSTHSDRRVEGVWQSPCYIVFQYNFQRFRVRMKETRSSEQARPFTFLVAPIFPVVFHFVFLSCLPSMREALSGHMNLSTHLTSPSLYISEQNPIP
jgi:hypothetical protein